MGIRLLIDESVGQETKIKSSEMPQCRDHFFTMNGPFHIAVIWSNDNKKTFISAALKEFLSDMYLLYWKWSNYIFTLFLSDCFLVLRVTYQFNFIPFSEKPPVMTYCKCPELLMLAVDILMLKTETVFPKRNITFPTLFSWVLAFRHVDRIVSEPNTKVSMYSGVKSRPKIRCHV